MHKFFTVIYLYCCPHDVAADRYDDGMALHTCRAVHSQSTMPKEYTSALTEYLWLAITSGAMYWKVPRPPVSVLRSCVTRDSPKSATRTL